MNNFNKLSLELKNSVNNVNVTNIVDKLIFDIKHNISIKDYENSLKNYYFDFENYIGFDLESLNYYENWLGDNIGRD